MEIAVFFIKLSLVFGLILAIIGYLLFWTIRKINEHDFNFLVNQIADLSERVNDLEERTGALEK